eukprot:m.233489 g.233489  ORF g.233489 m.233489 type:complete len:495 (+) comp12523_c0_seq1:145-1629(+)
MDGVPKELDLPTFQRVMADGEKLERIGSYRKAIEAYTTALEAVCPNGPMEDPVGRVCLCSRSRCYLQIGDHEAALKDAEAALKDDKTFIKGIFAKAEALYFKGDFEFSLVFYHRGNKLRSELQEFRLGIQKAREAIINAVGSPEACALEVPAEPVDTRTQSAIVKANTQRRTNRTQGNLQQTQRGEGSGKADKTVKQLLGDLYSDRQYLEDLLSEPWAGESNPDMAQLVSDGISYLDTRADFWRQQKPIYAREHESKLRMTKKATTTLKASDTQRSTAGSAKATTVSVPLSAIEEKLDSGDCTGAIKQAKEWLARADDPSTTAALHWAIGTAYLDLDDVDNALKHHTQAVALARSKGVEKAVLGRCLGGAGRAHARAGNNADALKLYNEKLPLTTEPAELAWLHHEIGRALIDAGEKAKALEHAEKCAEAAVDATSTQWRLNAAVLLGQAHVANDDHNAATTAFLKAKDLAAELDDAAVTVSIDTALAKLEITV